MNKDKSTETGENEGTKLTAEEMEQVKGGPAYIKFEGVDGETNAVGDPHKKWVDLGSVQINTSRKGR